MLQELRTSLTIFLFFMLVTGLGYPFLMLGIGKSVFPDTANGSLIKNKGKVIGSSLIGQKFDSDRYFHPRPSAAGKGYDASNSSGSNLAPTSPELLRAVKQRATELKEGSSLMTVPVSMVTSSASGLDPHITPASARMQVGRIAKQRGLPLSKVEELVTSHIELPTFGLLGEKRVNVLLLNMALDELKASSTAP